MVDTLPSNTEIQALFKSCSSEDDYITTDEFRELCYRLLLSPTTDDISAMIKELDKKEDSKLSLEEVSGLIEKNWSPIAERKVQFKKDLDICRKGKTGPITCDELRDILTHGDEHNTDKLSQDELDYIFKQLGLHDDTLIDEEELIGLIFKIEALSRAQSRMAQNEVDEVEGNQEQDDVPDGERQVQQVEEAQQEETQGMELQGTDDQQVEAEKGQEAEKGPEGRETEQAEQENEDNTGNVNENTEQANEESSQNVNENTEQANEDSIQNVTDNNQQGNEESSQNVNENTEPAEGETSENSQQNEAEQQQNETQQEAQNVQNDNDNVEQGVESTTQEANDQEEKKETADTPGEQTTNDEEESSQQNVDLF